MTRCLIADDHPGVLRALADSLRANGFEVITAGNGRAAVKLAADNSPECAVVDYRMPGVEGPDLLMALRAASPGTALIVYTAEASHSLFGDVSAAGAGVVFKDAPLDDVLRAVQSALEGKRYVDAALEHFEPALAPPLSCREREVLSLVANGLEYAEIAERLGIGAETARTHLKKACLRLGAATRTQAVARALREGWID
jgi:two-component system nitrate/nitrite response regulator NarL